MKKGGDIIVFEEYFQIEKPKKSPKTNKAKKPINPTGLGFLKKKGFFQPRL